MEIKSIRITFGGLVMLVQREKEPGREGLYGLMPSLLDQGMKHCPLLYVAKQFVVGNKNTAKDIRGLAIDLRWLAKKGTRKSFDTKVLEMGRYVSATSQVPVALKWLDYAPAGCLATRIELPLGSSEFRFGETAELHVPDPADATKWVPGNFTGIVTIDINAPVHHISKLEIAGVELKPNSSGHVEIAFLNVRVHDLDGKKYRKLLGQEMKHQSAYYRLLDHADDKYCKGEIPIRHVKSGKTEGTEIDPHSDFDCSKAKYKATVPAVSFIDPFNCTIGGGCPPNDNC